MDPKVLTELAELFESLAASCDADPRGALPLAGFKLAVEARTWRAAALWCRDALAGVGIEVSDRPAVVTT